MKRRDLIAELKGLNPAQLKERAVKLSEELLKLRFRHSSGQLEQTSRLGAVRRELARVKTVLAKAGLNSQQA